MNLLSKLTQGLVRGTTVAHNHEQAGATPAPATSQQRAAVSALVATPRAVADRPKSAEPYMQVVCAWCKQSMGRKLCVPEMANEISHSICGPCFAEHSVPDLCRKIKQADIYALVKIALDDLRTVEGGVANGLRELVRRRLEQLVYENHKPQDDL